MNKALYFVILFLFAEGCSLNKNSKFWSSSKSIKIEENYNYQQIFSKEKSLNKEFNSTLNIKLKFDPTRKIITNLNNKGQIDFDKPLKKTSRYKFSRIKNFYRFEPVISSNRDDLIFFDNNGSILQFKNDSKLNWKKNYYTKQEKKLKPILQFANNKKNLIVADNIAKYYMLDLENGDLKWSMISSAPFNSQIKIFENKFLIIDFSNTLRCFSIKDGKEIWNIKTDRSLARSQKRLSMVIINRNVYFNNSVGDISAVDIDKGELLWQLPTQSSLIYESAFSLETSDIIADKNTLFFSNNKNQIFSLDILSGSFNWENKINSNITPTLVDNYLFSISIEGFLIIIEKDSGNIIRVTDLFNILKPKQRNKIKPTGFIVGTNNIYLSTNYGRLFIIDIGTGRTTSILKIDNEKISRPFVIDKNLFVIKDNAIIKLN